jgi:hypothetical protein
VRRERCCSTTEHGRLKTSWPRLIAETTHIGFMKDDEGRNVLELRNCLRVQPGADAPCQSTIAVEVGP